jgi:hypothetical protein
LKRCADFSENPYTVIVLMVTWIIYKKGNTFSKPLVDTHGLTPVALAKEVFIYFEGCMPSNSL